MISIQKYSDKKIFKSGKLILSAAAFSMAWLLPLSVSTTATAAYPEKPIKIVIPFAPGGPSDVLGRAIAQKLNAALGQPVLAENKPGAGTNLAAEFVAKSAPDGYTLLLMMVGTQAINEAMYTKMAYNTLRDFAPITLTAASSLMLAAHPSVPAKNLKDLVALVKANPAKFNYGTAGAGTPLHLGGLLLNNLAGTDLQHIGYKGAAPAMTDVLGGQIQLILAGTPSVLTHIKSGKLNAIGVTSTKRSPNAPDVPTIGETYPGFEVELVYALVAPAGTPKDVIARLNAEVTKALQDGEMRDKLAGQGFEVRTSTPEQLGTYMKSEITKWAPLVKESGVKPE
jgi:tripartite-type tricarboxylate transporter receptor subunit TctC